MHYIRDQQTDSAPESGGATDDARSVACYSVCEGKDGETIREGVAGREAGV